MGRRDRGLSLRDRGVRGAEGLKRQQVRQCWVYGQDADAVGPWPALLLEWKRVDSQWLALVVYAVTGEPRTTVVQTWVEARHLYPVANASPAQRLR